MSGPGLTILTVTRAESCVLPLIREARDSAIALGAEYVLVADGDAALEALEPIRPERSTPKVASAGYIESVLDEAIAFCAGPYVLRLDDDELPSTAMLEWLDAGHYAKGEHWKFPRVHLWGDRKTALVTPHLWPDSQTRLSLKNLSGSRRSIHSGSPFGGGDDCPAPIEHHKFLVKSLEERRAIVERYDGIASGAGTHFRPFSVPEDVYLPAEIAGCLWDWNGYAIGRPRK